MLVAEGLMVFYENMLALNNISIRCGENQIVGIFGANSAGKSTLMYTLSGIILDQMKKEKMRGGEQITVMGKISFQGRDISLTKPHLRARMGVILCPERRRLFPESSVLENLKIGAYLATKKEAKETLDYVLEIFSPLKKLLRRSAGFLSGGEQQMAAIGRALMAQPKLLLLDEPAAGMNPNETDDLSEIIFKIKDDLDLTILLIEHDMKFVNRMCDRVLVLDYGKKIFEGTPAEAVVDENVVTAYLGDFKHA
jgi:branched-chain amino acid transport system ATP-binding protein